MNKVYRLIWNAAVGLWQVAGELARGRGKQNGGRCRLAIAASILLLSPLPALAGTLPTGGNVIAGNGSIDRSGTGISISQDSQRLAIDWQSFSIGEGQNVRFIQPGVDSAALNRVLGPDVSTILGSLEANGQVFLINPNGVLFGADARVDVGGLVASTLAISTDDFMAGDYRFAGDSANAIINRGNIRAADGGTIALIAARIENTGQIGADRGGVLLGAGRKVRLDLGGPVKIEVEEAALDALIDQGGAVRADGGLVHLTARAAGDLASTVINHGGITQARSLEVAEGGDIVLLGEGGMVKVAGTLDVSAPAGAGGMAVVTGGQVLIDDGALIDATGTHGGGEIYVGGGWQGQDPQILQATGTVITRGATLDASATGLGDGGTVVAWSDVTDSDSVTRVGGTLRARGGARGGDGGRIETSGHELGVGATPDVSAPAGRGGEWLIDPYNITVVEGGGNSGINDGSPFQSTGNGATLGVDLIDAALQSGDVTLQTGDGGSEGGDITWHPDYEYAGATDRRLTLFAHRDIFLNGSIGSSNGALSMAFNADSDGNGTGGTVLMGDLSTRGGSLTFNGVGAIFMGDTAQTLSTQGGDVDFLGEVLLANPDGLSIHSAGGDITFRGTVDSGNRYAYDPTERTWLDARSAVDSGAPDEVGATYLATITSALENTAVMAVLGGRQAWAGGSDRASEGVWRWVTGPEGMEDGGQGRIFWNRGATGATGATGYTGHDGAYVNWNSGEPNNSNGAEHNLQVGFSTKGLWNDLTDTSQLGSAVETNLADSPLHLNAGSGTVRFNDAVGRNKPLAGLIIAASGAVEIGDATFSRDVSVQASGNITLAGDLDTGGGDLYIDGGRLHIGGADIASRGGDLTLVAADRISLSGARLISSGGDIGLRGAPAASALPDPVSDPDGFVAAMNASATSGLSGHGIHMVSASVVDAAGGDIDIRGAGTSGRRGVFIEAGGVVRTNGDGAVGIYGLGGASANEGDGIYLRGAGSHIETQDGDMRLYGVGQGTNFGQGVTLETGSPQLTSRDGDIVIRGLSLTTGGNAQGVRIYGEIDVSGTGDIEIVGRSVGESSGGHGIFFGQSGVHAALGEIRLSGFGSESGGGDNAGIRLDNSDFSAFGDGPIALVSGGGDGVVLNNAALHGGSGELILEGESVTLGAGSVIGGAGQSGAIAVIADTLDLSGSLQGTGTLLIQPLNNARSIGLGDGAAGALHLGAAELSRLDGFSLVTVGRDGGSGAIQLGDAAFGQDVRVRGGGIAVLAEADVDTQGNRLLLEGSGSFSTGAGSSILTHGGDFLAVGSSTTLRGTIDTGAGDLHIGDPARDMFLHDAAALVTTSGDLTLLAKKLELHGPAALESQDGDIALTGTTWIADYGSGGASIIARGAGSISMESGQVTLRLGARVEANGGDIHFLGTPGFNLNNDAFVSNPTGLVSIHITGANGYIRGGEGARITARYLSISGESSVEMATAVHDVDFLAVDVDGHVAFHNEGSLTIGSAGNLSGVTAGGPIAISTTDGDLTIEATVATTDASAAAIVLNAGAASAAGDATGGNVVLGDGADLLAGPGGRTLLYTGSLAGSAATAARLGAGSGRFRYNSDEGLSNFTTALGSDGAWLVYREQPLLAVTPDTRSSVYGDTVSLSGLDYSLNGLRNGDSMALAGIGGSAVFGSDAAADANAGVYDIHYVGGLASALGYGFEGGGTGGEYTIERRPVSLTGARHYDGTGSLDADVFTPGNLVEGETLALTGTGAMADKHVGDGKAVDASGLTLADGAALAANYTLAGGDHRVDITPAAITVSTDAVSKVYDGTTAAAGSAALIGGDLFDTDTLSGGDFAFTDRNAGDGKTVTVTNVTVDDGNGGENYRVSYADNTASEILRRTITVSGITAADKVYDGDVTASVDASGAVFDDLVHGDDVVVTASGEFDGADAGTHTVRIDSHYGGADRDNYAITDQANTTATIAQRELTLAGGFSAADKVYDGNAGVVIDPAALQLENLVEGEGLALTDLIAAFNDANAGSNKTVMLLDATLADGAAGKAANYRLSLTGAPTAEAAIAQRVVHLDGSRIYDGSNALAATLFELGNLVEGETLALTGTGAMADKHVGNDKAVDSAGLALTDGGGLAANYTLAGGDHTVDITPAAITVSTDDVSKVYDGTTAAAGSAVLIGGNLFDTDTLSGGDFAFTDRNAGDGKTVTVTNVIVDDGNGGANYRVSYADNTASEILRRTITVSGIVAGDKVYDGTANASIDTGSADLANLVHGDEVTLNATGRFGDARAGDGKEVILANHYAGADVDNYDIIDQTRTTASITPRQITVIADPHSKAFGINDPVLSWTLGAGDLVGDDRLAGGLLRETGERIGSYRIGRGSLGHDDYAIDFVPGTLTIVPLPELDSSLANARHVSAPETPQAPGQQSASPTAPLPGDGPDDTTGSGLVFIPIEASAGAAARGAGAPIPVFVVSGGIRMPYDE